MKEIDITYQVEALTTDRDFTVYYANDINGEDVVHDTATLLWQKTYTMKSDTSLQREFYIEVYCGEDANNISQTITTRIIEDGVIVAELSTGGTSFIDANKTFIYAYLPSINRWED